MNIACLTCLTLTATVWQQSPAAQQPPVCSVLITLSDQVEVPARAAGVLAEVPVRPGQIVDAGHLLARIEDEQPRLARQRAGIELEIARKQASNDVRVRYARKSAEVSQAELQRAVESIEKYKRSISETELDRLRLEAQRATLEVEQAEHDLDVAAHSARLKEAEHQTAEYEVQRRRIAAPIGGVIVEVHRRRGEWVEPGDAVMRLVRIDLLRAEGFLDARNLAIVSPGCRALLRVDLPHRPAAEFSGEVVFVSPEIDPVNGQVRFWAEIDNHQRLLRPGLQGTLTIEPTPTTAEARR